MDLWVVAAAAGAGYLSKFCQNFSQNRESSSGVPSGSSALENPKSQALIQDQRTCETSPRGDDSVSTEVASTSDLSSVIAPTELRKDENFEGSGVDSCVGEVPRNLSNERRGSYGPERSKNSLRRKCANLQLVRPRSSLDSCLMAQMCGEEGGIEEYLLSPLVSPCTSSVRPFVVSDGRRVISRSRVDIRNGLHKEVDSKANGKIIGVPYLPKSRGINYSKMKLNKDKNHTGKSNSASKSQKFNSQGSASGQVLFSFGISVGIVLNIIANKLEVEKLRENLKRTQNLVQDLQEELDMKDSLTVKEITNNGDSQSTHKSKKLETFSMQGDAISVIKCNGEEPVIQKEAESISKIEAELEEELERLEQSMRGSALRGKSSDDVEFEPDLDDDVVVAELVHGELNPNIIRQRSSSEPSPERDSSCSPSTPLSAKHGVPPHELCLRLHEVIRSRLEGQIKELETELAKTQKRVQSLEAERMLSWSESSSTTLGSPLTVEAHSPMATQPLVLSLSGDALDAYNETYEELHNLTGSINGSSKIRVDYQQQHNLVSANQNGFRDCRNGKEGIPTNATSPNCYFRDKDDVDDLLLIKQIVEKARQGSPAVLRAQRALVYLNKDVD